MKTPSTISDCQDDREQGSSEREHLSEDDFDDDDDR